jgi:hypothetical protein
MTLPELRKQIEQYLELDGRRTEGPWEATFVFGSADLPIAIATADAASTTIVGILEGDCSDQPSHDLRFIAAAANQSAGFARALLVAIEKLQIITIQTTSKEYQEECGEELDGTTCIEAWDALITEVREALTTILEGRAK